MPDLQQPLCYGRRERAFLDSIPDKQLLSLVFAAQNAYQELHTHYRISQANLAAGKSMNVAMARRIWGRLYGLAWFASAPRGTSPLDVELRCAITDALQAAALLAGGTIKDKDRAVQLSELVQMLESVAVRSASDAPQDDRVLLMSRVTRRLYGIDQLSQPLGVTLIRSYANPSVVTKAVSSDYDYVGELGKLLLDFRVAQAAGEVIGSMRSTNRFNPLA